MKGLEVGETVTKRREGWGSEAVCVHSTAFFSRLCMRLLSLRGKFLVHRAKKGRCVSVCLYPCGFMSLLSPSPSPVLLTLFVRVVSFTVTMSVVILCVCTPAKSNSLLRLLLLLLSSCTSRSSTGGLLTCVVCQCSCLSVFKTERSLFFHHRGFPGFLSSSSMETIRRLEDESSFLFSSLAHFPWEILRCFRRIDAPSPTLVSVSTPSVTPSISKCRALVGRRSRWVVKDFFFFFCYGRHYCVSCCPHSSLLFSRRGDDE